MFTKQFLSHFNNQLMSRDINLQTRINSKNLKKDKYIKCVPTMNMIS